LSDLKVYIALNEHPFQLQKVSMKMVLADVLKQMKARIDEAQAEVSFTELPDVSADRELVEKLLTQLIDNALKFRKKDKKPVIDIGFDKFEGNIIFCVRDNGIGISKRYYHKIFDLFEKLNRVDEYPGNGLGLAISKKITDLHGGEIWVESLPGSGSNFYFTLKGK
ncbi:MAG TPA: ATP-binding protein, partial [Chitinophagales bacterium]|nr:ATP-binding protein [Chitinophagales bacterium]